MPKDSDVRSKFYGANASPDYLLGSKTTMSGMDDRSAHAKRSLFTSPRFTEEIMPFGAGDMLDTDSEMRVSDANEIEDDDELLLNV